MLLRAARSNPVPDSDPELSRGLPEWVRFGTALRGVEHAIGALCHPKATDAHRKAALEGLALVVRGLRAMTEAPEALDANIDAYRGGWITIRALNSAGYPAVAHFVQNHYSARFGVHQGSCSGVIGRGSHSARVLLSVCTRCTSSLIRTIVCGAGAERAHPAPPPTGVWHRPGNHLGGPHPGPWTLILDRPPWTLHPGPFTLDP